MNKQAEKRERIAAMVPRLKEWQTCGLALYEAQDAAYKAIGSSFDSPFWEVIFAAWKSYTRAVAELVGDDGEWLDWFDCECDLGRRPKLATLSNGKAVCVKTVQQLAGAIMA